MNPSSVGSTRRMSIPVVRVVFLMVAAILGNGLIAYCGQTVSSNSDKPLKPSDALMLVREWDPGSGKLVGWLPMHQTVIELDALDRSPGLHFNPNDAIQLRWPVRPKQVPEVGGIQVTPAAKNMDGKSWVPAEREPNLVRIGHRYYLIRTITFVENGPGAPAREVQQAQGMTGFRRP